MTIRLLLAALLVFGLPTAVTYVQQTSQASEVVEQEIYIVRTRASEALVEADGEIEADSVLNLSFEVNGLVKDLYVDEGTFVREGDVIAVLENETERIDVANAQVSVDIAKVQREDIIIIDDDDIRLAEARVQSARNSYAFTANRVTQEDINAAELQYNAAVESVEAAREARIRGGGDTYIEAVDLLDAQIGEAMFNAEVARLRLENLKDVNKPQEGAAAMNIEAAEANLALILAGPTEFQIADADLAVEAAEQNLRQAQRAFERTVLKAPADGVITDLRIEEGQRVTFGNTVMQLVDKDPLHATVEVDEIDYRQVAIGMDVLVTLDALPGVSFPATVTRIAPEGKEVAGVVVYETEAEINEPDARIRVGMSAKAYFGAEQNEDILVVPERFISEDGTVERVRTDGTIETVNIVTDSSTTYGIEVTSGLSAGDALVAASE